MTEVVSVSHAGIATKFALNKILLTFEFIYKNAI